MADMTIFANDAFRAATLTTALNRRPHKPGFLGAQGIFTPRPVRTVTVAIESRNGTLSLIKTSERGAPLQQAGDVRHALVSRFRVEAVEPRGVLALARHQPIHHHRN